jgi:hypothetical protein
LSELHGGLSDFEVSAAPQKYLQDYEVMDVLIRNQEPLKFI